MSQADGKDDMFVDAPEELNADNKEAVAIAESENAGALEDKPNVEAELSNGVDPVVGDDNHYELGRVHSLLEQALREKERIENEYKEEREALVTKIHMKDQEIEGLNARIVEFAVSDDVSTSYMHSVAEVATESRMDVNRNVEVSIDRILAALASVVGQDELFEGSGGDKMAVVENGTSILIEKLNQFLYGSYQLRQCLSKAESALGPQEELGAVIAAACDDLLELRRKEEELLGKIGHLEEENRKLLEQVEREKSVVEMVNSELGKTKQDLEQEKQRCANTKEKLSMAVTKGKALVQQRDSLKQSLADKTSELEKCMAELDKKSSALEAAELSREEFVKNENLTSSLQEALSQKSLILETFEYILSQTDVPEELQLVDIVGRARWLVHERNELKGIAQNFHTLKDTISSLDFPENIPISDLKVCIDWLKGSYYQAKEEIRMLQDEVSRTREAAHNEIENLNASILTELQQKDNVQKELGDLACKYEEIVANAHQLSLDKDRLSVMLSTELQEKDYIQNELDDLKRKYEDIVDKAHQLSLEKHQMLRLLLDGCGITMEDQEMISMGSSDLHCLIDRCIGSKVTEQRAATNASHVDVELFERLKSLLYLRYQELMLCEEMLEEDAMVRSQLNDLSNKLRVTTQELASLKEEKDLLQKDLERSEEKTALLREKLSMAVKKGKGLVQDRENLKLLIDEKNSEIEKLRSELQQQESRVAELTDQIGKLSTDLECIPRLEADLAAMKDQHDQLKKFLSESNNLLQSLIESIDHIVLPFDKAFEDPVQKVKWVDCYVVDCQHAKTQVEEELMKVKQEVSTLAMKLAEADISVKSLEDALSVAKNEITQLDEDRRKMELNKKNIEKELQEAVEEASSQTIRFAEACESRKSLEEALSVAENKILLLVSEKEEALSRIAVSEMEVEKVREEVATQTSRLTEAYNTIKLLENGLSEAETNFAALTKQNSHAEAGRINLESELEKLKVETEGLVIKLADASATIESLKVSLTKAENNISALEREKSALELEISTLSSRLNACMEELAGKSGNLVSRSLELASHLRDLDMLVKDESFQTLMNRCFSKSLEGLKHLDLTIAKMRGHLADESSKVLADHLIIEDTAHIAEVSPDDFNHMVSNKMENGEVNTGDDADVSLSLKMTAAGLEMRNQFFADRFKHLSTFVEESIVDLLKKLEATSDEVMIRIRNLESLKQESKGIQRREQEKERVIGVLASACTNATKQLLFEVDNSLPEVRFVPELEKLSPGLLAEIEEIVGDGTAEQKVDGSESVKIVEKLLAAATKVQSLIKLFVSASKVASSTIQELQKELSNNRTASQKDREERDLYMSEVSKLESNMETLQDSCKELNIVVEDYQAKENNWKEKEAELSASYNSLLMKAQDLQKELDDIRTASKKDREEKDSYHSRVSKLEGDVEALQDSCKKLNLVLEEYRAKENKWKETEAELSSSYNSLLMKTQEAENHFLSASQIRTLFNKVSKIEVPFMELELEEPDSYHSVDVEKLFYIIDNVTRLQYQITLLSRQKGELESTLSEQAIEIDHLKKMVETYGQSNSEFEKMKGELSELTFGLEKIIGILEGKEFAEDRNSVSARSLLLVLEKHAMVLSLEAQNLKSHCQELESKLLASQKSVDEMSSKVKVLEDSLQARTVQPEIVQERSALEASSAASGSEISEVEDLGSLGKKPISPVPSAAHVRTLRKGSADHLALSIDSESDRLITTEETVEDKGHVFKSLNTSGFIPKQGKLIADRVDGIWISGGRVLSNHPRARLGLIAYCLVLHMWVLGTIL